MIRNVYIKLVYFIMFLHLYHCVFMNAYIYVFACLIKCTNSSIIIVTFWCYTYHNALSFVRRVSWLHLQLYCHINVSIILTGMGFFPFFNLYQHHFSVCLLSIITDFFPKIWFSGCFFSGQSHAWILANNFSWSMFIFMVIV